MNRLKLPRNMSKKWWRLILKRSGKDKTIYGGWNCHCCNQKKHDSRKDRLN